MLYSGLNRSVLFQRLYRKPCPATPNRPAREQPCPDSSSAKHAPALALRQTPGRIARLCAAIAGNIDLDARNSEIALAAYRRNAPVPLDLGIEHRSTRAKERRVGKEGVSKCRY